MGSKKPITRYAKMWPRTLFNCRDGKRSLVKDLDVLSQPGVYVLYRDDVPYYVGKATRLRTRLGRHANHPGGRYYNFWNFFSVFVVEDPRIRSDLEGALIAAMPTANGAKPKMSKAQLPATVRAVLHKIDQQPIQLKMRAASAGR